MLLADERDIDAPNPPQEAGQPAVEVKCGSFSWDPPTPAAAASTNGATPAGAGNGGKGSAPSAASSSSSLSAPLLPGGSNKGGKEQASTAAAPAGGEGKSEGKEGEGKSIGLTDVSLSVEPGKLVAIVGGTGERWHGMK